MLKRYNLVIILVNYNSFQDTYDCIESIKKTQGELPYLVVVDNASKNPDLLDGLKDTYPELHLIKNLENVGFGRANNQGIQWAQKNIDFEYLLLLNNDTLVEPDSFKYLQEAFKKGPNIGIATSKIMYEGDRDIVWYGGGDINYKRGWPKIIDYNMKATSNGAEASKLVSFVSGCVMMFSKASIAKLRGFDDAIFMYCEDLELSMRALKEGYTLYYEPKSIIYHKVQGSSKSSNKEPTALSPKNSNALFLFYHMRTNQYFVMRKFLKGKMFIVFNLMYCTVLIKNNLTMVINRRFGIIPNTFKVFKNIMLNRSAT